jgi:GNAT superfamily N-acetyltransferase
MSSSLGVEDASNEGRRTVVRGYEPGDRDALLALAGRLVIGVAPWRDAQAVSDAVRQWVADSIATANDGRGALFVATDQAGQVKGFVSVSERRHFAGAVDAYVGELVTAEDAEGQGVGRTLLGRAEEWAREHDYPRITLETGARNLRALWFYEHLGWEPEDIRLSKAL